MLQQTQVGTVIGYYERFLRRFADVQALAAAPLEDVLECWAGLGYYARARMAHRCAQAVTAAGGRFPDSAQALEQLPGIGPSTAAAIAAFCYGERAAILDANVKRVLARHRAIEGDPKQPAVLSRLWDQARAMLPPARDIGRYTQAIMDLGATVCTRTRPQCDACPVRADCLARQQDRTAELPGRSPAAQRPLRRMHLLVALQGDAVLVEERPPAGIWGGLLSLPEFPGPDPLEAAARTLGAGRLEALEERHHGFTHFTLAYTPHVLRIHADVAGARPAATARNGSRHGARPAPAAREASRHRWLPLSQIETAALPAPIRVLLLEVRAAPAAGTHRARTRRRTK